MKKILNADTDCVVEEMLEGYLGAYERYYERVGVFNAFYYKKHRKNKVNLVIGGGSGHEPMFGGFVGKGLADAVACGNICASPNPQLIIETAKAVEEGKGILFVYGCYAGDNMNFDMAEELCEFENIETAHVRVRDDCVSAPKDRWKDRRGIAGMTYVVKIAGAVCDTGCALDEAVRVTQKAVDNIATIGVAVSPGTLPGNEKPAFELGENEIEFGMGIHGEPGIERTTMQTADKMVDRIYTRLKEELQLSDGEEVAVLVNGLGSTPLLELDIVYKELRKQLNHDRIRVHDSEIKTWCTCQEMGGFSISILRIDDELKKYYDEECFSPFYARQKIED